MIIKVVSNLCSHVGGIYTDTTKNNNTHIYHTDNH